MAISSSIVTFVDTTDTQKVDIYISSNYPVTQIKDTNLGTFTPSWIPTNDNNPLKLSATVYADSTNVSNLGATYNWFQDKVEGEPLCTDRDLIIETNVLDNSQTGMVTYICKGMYNKKPYENSITFSLVKTGANGTSAPIIQAQYSADGANGTWESALDPIRHKYIRFSYDGGVNWTASIKIAGEKGEDGQSVFLKGTAYTTDELVVGNTVRLYSDATAQNDSTLIQGNESGDSYLVDGYLCVYNGTNFICTGQLQGPKGKDGVTYYLYIRYADNTSGSGFSIYPDNKKYIGFYRTTSETLPSNVDKTSATWNWAKFVGDNAKTITLTGTGQAFKVDRNNAVLPTTIKVTAQAENTSVTSWTYRVDNETVFTNTVPTGVSQSGNDVTITGSAMLASSIAIKASDGTRSDVFTVYRVSDGNDGRPGDNGESAPTVFLTNENITFAANEYGQVPGITVDCDVVAYVGTTEVTPEVGPISDADLPEGMSLGERSVEGNKVRIPIKIADGATLGSAQNENGIIPIAVTSPVSANLKLTWSKVNSGVKGDAGVGINSVTVDYGVSTSASTQPTTWQSSVPVVAEGSYLWTRTVTAYTDNSKTVTYTYAKQGVKGDTGSQGSSVTVSKIEYQAGASATTAPTGTWSSGVVAVTEGNYLWTKTTFSDNNVAYGVTRQGVNGTKGNDGKGISSIVEQYYQSTSATAQSGGTWSTIVPTWVDGKYIWTRSVITYTDSTTQTTSPVCITGQKGGTGVGVASVDVWYYQSSSATSLSGGSWSTTAPTWADGKYVWTKTITTYTDTTTDETSAVCITGQKGNQGVQGPKGNDGQQYYTWVKYADTPTSGMSDTPDGKAYIGLAYNKTTATESTTYSDYMWSLIKGETGAIGPKGNDGQTYYTWIKYADNASGANMSDSPSGKSYIGLAYNKTTSTESNTASDYTWALFKGNDGVGIASTTVTYGVSDSSSTQPSSWQSAIPTVAEGKYLWTRTVIDYTDTAKADTVSYTYAKQGTKGDTGSAGSSVTVTSIQYQEGTSATTAPTGTWSNSVVSVADGKYLWTKTVFSDGKTAYGVAKQGSSGRGVKSVTEYYLATASSSGVTTSTSGWTTAVQTITIDKKYLWNYEVITYTDDTTSPTSPIIIGVFGNTGATGSTGATGKGIKSVTEYYLATSSSSGVTTSTSGWTTTMQTLTSTNKYLWNYELITYTDDSKATINPVIIGVYGDKGSQGDKGVDAVTFQVYAPNGYLLTKDLESLTLQTFAYEGSTAVTSGATYQWAQYNEGAWENISGATTQTLTVTKADVVKSKSYKCTMTYKSKQYTDTATVQDKTDIYSSLIQTAAKYSSTNKYYWVLYSMVYSDEGERDKLLGPINTIAPDNPTSGQYWYKIDETNYTVTLMKYSGTTWTTTTDKQELVYDWSLINDADIPISLGAQSKVKIVTASDFSKTCSVQCNIRGSESIPISYSNQILIDPSDPIISSEEPINPTPGQLWIKASTNGLYTLLVWDASLEKWVTSEADSRVKVHISKPSSYEVGDVWVVGSDYEPTIYINGVAQTTKHLTGTMLKAQYSSQSYKDSDWVEALNYKKEIDNLKENLNTYNQFFSFDTDGLTMQAKKKSGEISEFKTKLTNTELGFYQGENKVAHINNNQLNISKAEITNGMTITGSAPALDIGKFTIIQESNGSLSIGLKS